MSEAGPGADPDRLLDELGAAVRAAKVRPREIEVGIALSVALGRARGQVACGGCQVPLEFDGIPARTNVHLPTAFRLIADPAA